MKLPLKLIISETAPLSDIAELTLVDADDVLVEASVQDLQEAVNAYNNYPRAMELLRRVSESDPGRIDDLDKDIISFLLSTESV